jgi:glycosyltransferase involved in cell wall biosynthesis
VEQKVLSGRAPTWVDVSQTCRTRANTGVQRVVRSLLTALGPEALPVRWDESCNDWRVLDARRARLLSWSEDARPSASRSSAQRSLGSLMGRVQALFGTDSVPPTPEAFITAEVFLPEVGNALPTSPSTGLRTAIFHDALPLLHPTLCAPSVLERFPLYLDQLRRFDRVLAVSEQSRKDLLAYWRWLGGPHPTVGRVHLPVRLPVEPRPATPPVVPRIVCIGTLEPRKNHGVLLDAAEDLWARGLRFALDLAGAPHASADGRACAQRIHRLERAECSLTWHRNASDRDLARLLASSAFSVFPSIAEGYGLPIAESLAAGVPCICSAKGATGELAAGGGCVSLSTVDAPSLAAAMQRLLEDPAHLEALAQQAKAREFTRTLEMDPEGQRFHKSARS